MGVSGFESPDIYTIWACCVYLRTFPVKGAGPLVAGSVNASCFLCLNVPLSMTVNVDLSEKHPNMFIEETLGPHSAQLLFCGEKREKITPEWVVFVSCGSLTNLVMRVAVASLRSSRLFMFPSWKIPEEKLSDRLLSGGYWHHHPELMALI